MVETYFWTVWLLRHTQNKMLYPEHRNIAEVFPYTSFLSLCRNLPISFTVYSLEEWKFVIWLPFEPQHFFSGLHSIVCWLYKHLRLRIHSVSVFLNFFLNHGIVVFSKEMRRKRWGHDNCQKNSFLSSLCLRVGNISWWLQCRMLNLRGGTEWEDYNSTPFVFFFHSLLCF